MPVEPEEEQRVMQSLQEHGQGHVLRRLEKLPADGRERLLEQLAGVDFERLEDFRELVQTPPTEISFSAISPAPVRRLPLTPSERKSEERIVRLGAEALSADRVAACTVAGGQGTRLHYDHPKGMYPVSPIRRASLFQLFAEQILAARRRYGCRMPWLIMTSPSNDAETREFFAENDHFGLGAESVHFFVQGSNPIITEEGELLLAEEDRLLTGPDGHGGTFDALSRAGLFDVLRAGGWDLISYFQVDNPLVTVADQRFIGHHLAKDADFSCKVVPKRAPEEGLGIAVLRAGKPVVVEYIDVPPDTAAQRLPSGQLVYLYGSIAIHIISVPFAERVGTNRTALPWHLARKQYEIVDEEGHKALAPPKSCCKFECFIFDALALADDCAFVEVRRDTEFGPVKNAEGEDSPQTARRLMQRMWLEWLIEAGALPSMPADVPEGMIEVSPLFAASAEELKERIEPGLQVEFPLLLEP